MIGRRPWLILCVFVAVVLDLMLPLWHEADFVSRGQGERPAGDVLLDALGEVRTFMAKCMWLDVDVYHHALEGQGRAFSDEKDLMPLLRMVILLDPTFEEAYATAAFHLVLDFDRPEEGMALLKQGLARRPRSQVLRFERAYLAFRLKRYGEAADAGEAAFVVSTTDIDQMNALRIVTHASIAEGHYPRAMNALQQWLSVRPGDPTALKLLDSLQHGQNPDDVETPAVQGSHH